MTSTPSTTSRINGTAIENAFPTPPTGTTAPEKAFHLKSRMSPGPRRFLPPQRAQSTPPELTESSQYGILTTGSRGLSDVTSLEHSWSRLGLSKKRSQYYDNAFAYREANNTAKERVAKDSVILAEVKLNCCVDSEKEFLIDLSFRLSEIYQRPPSCIMAMVTTDVQMLLGASSEPAYHLTVTALPSEIAATKNKRSTHLIQDFMQDTLRISPKRGIVRFDAVMEENLATNGMTALQEIEELERQSSDEDGMLRALSRQRSRRSKKSIRPAFTDRFRVGLPSIRSTTPSSQRFNTAETTQTKPAETIGLGRKRVKKRQSVLGFFKR